jgi:hypothetical protein
MRTAVLKAALSAAPARSSSAGVIARQRHQIAGNHLGQRRPWPVRTERAAQFTNPTGWVTPYARSEQPKQASTPAQPYLAPTDSNKLTANLAPAPALAGGGSRGRVDLAVNVTTPIRSPATASRNGNLPRPARRRQRWRAQHPAQRPAMTANTVSEAHTHAVITAVDGRLATTPTPPTASWLPTTRALGLASLSRRSPKPTPASLLLQPRRPSWPAARNLH